MNLKPHTSMRRALTIVCVTTLVLDIATTWYALKFGASEGNPVQARLFHQFGFWQGVLMYLPIDMIRVPFAVSYPFHYKSDRPVKVVGFTFSPSAARIICGFALATFALHIAIVLHNAIILDRLIG